MLFLGMSIFTLLQQNGYLESGVKFLSADTSTSLVTALAGVWLTLKGMSLNAMPYLVYDSVSVKDSVLGLNASKSGYRRIILRNTGAGMAIFEGVSYVLREEKVSRNELVQRLEALKIRDKEDYCLINISGEYALKPESELVLLEIISRKQASLGKLTLMLNYRNAFGEKYQRIICCGNS